jgi:hypothetical protein
VRVRASGGLRASQTADDDDAPRSPACPPARRWPGAFSLRPAARHAEPAVVDRLAPGRVHRTPAAADSPSRRPPHPVALLVTYCMLKRQLLLLRYLAPQSRRPVSQLLLLPPRPIAACRQMTTSTTSKKRPASPTDDNRPMPDEVAPEVKRRHVEADVPKPTQNGADEAKTKTEADDDWFKGMLCRSRLLSLDFGHTRAALAHIH